VDGTRITRVQIKDRGWTHCAVLGLNSGPQARQAGTLTLEPHSQSFFALAIFQIESHDFAFGWS
jgi:hypothetical protein